MTIPTTHTVVISTRNKHKLEEIHAIMTNLPVKFLSLDAFPGAPEVDEDQNTLEGNAAKKAEILFKVTGHSTIADDTGLEVIALDDAPGVHSARFAGPNCDDRDNRVKLLQMLQGANDRRARFRTVIAFASRSGTYFFEGVCNGSIAKEERGSFGFGYDSLFIPDGFTTTFAEMAASEKNEISHRSRALKRFAMYFSGLVEGDL